MIDSCDQSKCTNSSTHDPGEALWSKDAFLFHHLWHRDSSGHLLRCLYLETWRFFRGQWQWQWQIDRPITLPLHKHTGYQSREWNKARGEPGNKATQTYMTLCLYNLVPRIPMKKEGFHFGGGGRRRRRGQREVPTPPRISVVYP